MGWIDVDLSSVLFNELDFEDFIMYIVYSKFHLLANGPVVNNSCLIYIAVVS